MKSFFTIAIVILLSIAVAGFAVVGVMATIHHTPEPVSNMAQSDSIQMLKLEIEIKQTVIDEQTKALKACDELTEQLMKGLE